MEVLVMVKIFLIKGNISGDEVHISVTVGMQVTLHPPYRSRRAEFPHRAPASGNTAVALQRIRMTNTD